MNMFIFPVMNRDFRVWLLKMFGATIGKECLFYRSVKIYAPWNLRIGDYSCVGNRVELYNKDVLTIGDDVVIPQDAYVGSWMIVGGNPAGVIRQREMK